MSRLSFLAVRSVDSSDRLWSVLAETRRVRRRIQLDPSYAGFFGITRPNDVRRLFRTLVLREKLVMHLLADRGFVT